MVNLDIRKSEPAPDRTNRTAALWATVVAVPVAVLVGVVAFLQMAPDDEPAAAPTASAPLVPATPVQMEAPKLADRVARVCLAVTSQLPSRLRDLPARRVSAGPEQNAAYGEPPITVACGVPQPVMCERPDQTAADDCVPLAADMLSMDGVCWYGQSAGYQATFTTMDREVAVRVAVPNSYPNAGQWANEFSGAVVKTVKSRTAGVPSGCR